MKSFDSKEFAMHFVLADNRTIYETMTPKLAELCDSNNLAPMLPALPAPGGFE